MNDNGRKFSNQKSNLRATLVKTRTSSKSAFSFLHYFFVNEPKTRSLRIFLRDDSFAYQESSAQLYTDSSPLRAQPTPRFVDNLRVKGA